MGSVIENIDQITAGWLTNALKASGCLPQGEVDSFSARKSTLEGFTSDRYHLELVYTENAPRLAPVRLFLKIGKPESFDHCRNEIEFYRLVIASPTDLPLPTCYDSSYSAFSKQSHLLLQDLSKTHRPPDLSGVLRDPDAPLPLTGSEWKTAIECLASVHALWWNDPRLGNEIGDRPSKESSIRFFEEDLKELMAPVFDGLEKRLSPEMRSVYERARACYPDLYWDHIESNAPLTVRHADAHIGNFMFPVDADRDPMILLDWQSWGVDLGITDVAHLIALNMRPVDRQLVERNLLFHYHNQLAERGVTDYSWNECWFGYRMQVIWMLFLPIFWHSLNLPLDRCWVAMENSYTAFQDLRCIELIEN